jgi:ubiquinone/menaquinone biosynthesis C-methylase UbiE
VKLYVIDAENIPFEDESFEVTLINGSLHHLPDYNRGVEEMTRVTKKGGSVIISFEPNRWHLVFFNNLIRLIKKILRITKRANNFSIADYNTKGFIEKDFEEIARKNNLKIITKKRVHLIQGFYSLISDYLYKLRGGEEVSYTRNVNFEKLDNLLIKIPLLNKLSWQWTVIYKKL